MDRYLCFVNPVDALTHMDASRNGHFILYCLASKLPCHTGAENELRESAVLMHYQPPDRT